MSEEKEYTGGSVSYYAVDVNAPINEASDPYTAECQDIIEALKLDFNEGNVLKAIWRRAAARLGRSKKGYDDGLYDAEKVVFYGQRLVAIEQRAKPKLPVRETHEAEAAVSTLENMGYTYCGGTLWKPPLGPTPDYIKKETDPYGPRDAEGWYTWNGDETMRPAGNVDYVCRNGEYVGSANAGELRWKHKGQPDDILKWRQA
ncbi:hypothetical protein D3C81_773700 [compost metagenome]